MEQNITELLKERRTRCGDFRGHAAITQAIKNAFHASWNWGDMTPSQKEAMEMVAHKFARILNGDPNYLDSWVDCVGYLQLVINELEGTK